MLKLIIVEDEDIIREGLISYVDWRSMGYQVIGQATNGEEGLSLIRQKNPDVILTDIRMPVMDGLKMLKEIRRENKDVSVVILSGYEDFEYARSAMKLGVSEYILKPLNIRKLEEAMEHIYFHHRAKEEKEKEYERLKSLEDYNNRQLQKNLIARYLLHQETEQADARCLQELEEYYYSVLITAQEGFSLMENKYDYLELAEFDKSFELSLTGILGEYENSVMIRFSMGERIICCWGRERYDLEEERKEMEQALKSRFDGSLSLCGSGIGYGLSGLLRIYTRAREKQKEAYLKTIGEIVRIENQEMGNLRYMSYDASSLFVEIKTGTYETVDRELEYFSQELDKQKISSHMHVLLLVSNLYSELMKLPEEVSSTAEEVFSDPMKYYRAIVTNTDKKEILGFLGEVCHQLNDFFRNINQGKFESILKRVLDFMQKEYANPTLQIKDVARAAYVSNSYLSIIIKQGTGKTFVEYLTELRMEQAAKLLKETELKSYEIAELCGFSNPTYFSTVFKSVYGMSPSAYKKKMKQNTREN